MSIEWRPENYGDEFRERLQQVVEARLRRKTTRAALPEPEEKAEEAAGRVTDFAILMRKSLETNQLARHRRAHPSAASARRRRRH
jgi:DNA end-binding protein Ku